jgi:hypothetical protein
LTAPTGIATCQTSNVTTNPRTNQDMYFIRTILHCPLKATNPKTGQDKRTRKTRIWNKHRLFDPISQIPVCATTPALDLAQSQKTKNRLRSDFVMSSNSSLFLSKPNAKQNPKPDQTRAPKPDPRVHATKKNNEQFRRPQPQLEFEPFQIQNLKITKHEHRHPNRITSNSFANDQQNQTLHGETVFHINLQKTISAIKSRTHLIWPKNKKRKKKLEP